MARAICLRLLAQTVRSAASRAFCTAGIIKPMRMAMIAMTTSSSIKVKPLRFFERRDMGDSPHGRRLRYVLSNRKHVPRQFKAHAAHAAECAGVQLQPHRVTGDGRSGEHKNLLD